MLTSIYDYYSLIKQEFWLLDDLIFEKLRVNI